MAHDDYSARRRNGSIEVQPLPKPHSGPPEFLEQITSRQRFEWQPPSQLSRLPTWFKLALDCYILRDGTRRFTLVELPEGDAERSDLGLGNIATARGLSLVASVGGHALLIDRGEIEPKPLLTLDEARLFLQYIEHRREFLGTRKALDTLIRSPDESRHEHRSKRAKSALPEDLGLDAQGECWSISKFNKEARDSAKAAGIENPTKRQLFSHGLFAAAKRNPLYLNSADQAEAITRLSLFALPESAAKATSKQLQYVADHVRASLHGRLEDSDEEFQKWIQDPKSDLLRRITRPRSCSMSRDQVKRVLLELGWYSLKLLAQCIDVQMRAFRDALGEPLTDSEDFYFRQVFLANPAFGGLPLLLLHDRYDDFSAAIIHVWNDARSRESVAVAHRVMAFYATFLGNRREADRLYKRRAIARNSDNQIAVEQELDEAVIPPSTSNEESQFLQIAKALAVRRGINCETGEWEAELLSANDSVIQFKLRGENRKRAKTIKVTRAEFEKTARKLQRSD